MFVSVPLVGDPRDQLLTALPFASPSDGIRCHNAIRRVFDATDENVQVMLNLSTLNGPALLEMVANVVRTESDVLIFLTGREVDSALAGLLHNSESVREGDAGLRVQQFERDNSETDVSSITSTSHSSPSIRERYQGLLESSNSATSGRADDEGSGQHTRARQSRRCFVTGVSDSSSQEQTRRNRRAIERRRYALKAACFRLRAVGAFMRNGRNKTKRMLAMWLRTNKRANLAVVRLIGECCWEDGWRGVARGGSDHTRMVARGPDAAAAAVVTTD
jgi:hypothetical protein